MRSRCIVFDFERPGIDAREAAEPAASGGRKPKRSQQRAAHL